VRRIAKADAIPEDLQAYDPARWVKYSLDNPEEAGIAHLPVEQRPTYFYTLRLAAPLSYKRALTGAIGARAAAKHFHETLEPCPLGHLPAGWTETW
jgi:hypothetical protein